MVIRAAGCLFWVEGFRLNYFILLQVPLPTAPGPRGGGRNNLVNDLTVFRGRILGVYMPPV